MNHDLRRLLICTTTLAAMSLAAPPATADWTENFDGGTTHNNWSIYDNDLNNPPNTSTVSYSANNLQIIGQPSVSPDLYVVGIVGLGDPQHNFEDVTVRGTVFAPQGTTLAGASARGNNDTFVIARTNSGGTSGYVLALDFQSGEVDLVRSDNAEITELNASGDIPAFDPMKSYVLELQAEGANLTGRVFDAGVPVVTVSTSDTSATAFSSGWSGIGSIINTNDDLANARTFIAAGFDDVSSTAITPPVVYDLTGDGQVTSADLATFVVNFGKSGGTSFFEGDFDANGHIGLIDLVRLRSQLISPNSAAVPEPTTWALGLIGLLLFLVSRRVHTCLTTGAPVRAI